MKRFKDLLNEFRENIPPIDRQRPQGDPFEEIKNFMKKVSYTHTTPQGDTIHFNDSHDAANLIANDRVTHTFGQKHAYSVRDEMMMRYFGNSTSTHYDMIDSLSDFITNHKKLPSHLKPHVNEFMRLLEKKARSRGDLENKLIQAANGKENGVGESIYGFMKPAQSETEHPHIDNPQHHLSKLIKTISEDPDRGYYLRKEEQM